MGRTDCFRHARRIPTGCQIATAHRNLVRTHCAIRRCRPWLSQECLMAARRAHPSPPVRFTSSLPIPDRTESARERQRLRQYHAGGGYRICLNPLKRSRRPRPSRESMRLLLTMKCAERKKQPPILARRSDTAKWSRALTSSNQPARRPPCRLTPRAMIWCHPRSVNAHALRNGLPWPIAAP